jgi:hypothetical protein
MQHQTSIVSLGVKLREEEAQEKGEDNGEDDEYIEN